MVRVYIQSREGLMKWLALDFETSDFNPYTCKIDRCCLIAGHHKYDVSWRLTHSAQELQAIIKAYKDWPLLAHNAKFELHLLRRLGIKFTQPLHDSMLMAKHYRNDYKRYALDALGKQFFDDDFIEYQELKKWLKHNTDQKASEFDLTVAPNNLVHDYCMHDVEVTLKIAELCYPSLKDNYAYQLDIATLPLVQKMEAYGIKADKEFYEDFVRRGKRRVAYNLNVAGQELGTKGTNRKPTGHALREHLQSRGERRTTPSGLVRTGEVTLRDHKGSRAVRAVCRVRTDQKAVNTYAVNILRVTNKDGFFHPNLKQSGAITRRFTSSGLFGDNGVIAKGNTQNFPRGAGLRDGIIVPDGFAFVKFDLASIEARLAAHAMSVFLDFDYYCKRYKADDKFNIYLHVMHEHTEHKTATKKDPIYTAYKHGVLGIQYGVGLPTFHRTMVDNFELPYSIEECKHIYETIRKNCPEFSALQRAVSSIVESQQFITDDFGAVYYVPEEERYKGVNYYCQGCAGNILKWWMLQVDKAIDCGDYAFNLIHDEIDMAVNLKYGTKKAKVRVAKYCGTLDKLDMFNLPIRAEASELVKHWGLS
jgi:DNA polymerase I-like protein with 3'-5' exonuclease and polymerase domains